MWYNLYKQAFRSRLDTLMRRIMPVVIKMVKICIDEERYNKTFTIDGRKHKELQNAGLNKMTIRFRSDEHLQRPFNLEGSYQTSIVPMQVFVMLIQNGILPAQMPASLEDSIQLLTKEQRRQMSADFMISVFVNPMTFKPTKREIEQGQNPYRILADFQRDIVEVIRHELQHAENFIENPTKSTYQLNNTPFSAVSESIWRAFQYLNDPNEKDAYIKGLMLKAKKERRPLADLIAEAIYNRTIKQTDILPLESRMNFLKTLNVSWLNNGKTILQNYMETKDAYMRRARELYPHTDPQLLEYGEDGWINMYGPPKGNNE